MKCPDCQSENPEGSLFCGKCGSRLSDTGLKSLSETLTIGLSFNLPAEGSSFANKYRIESEIGRGGMGIVFKAEDTKLKRPVALKILLPGLSSSPEARARFVREAQSAASLDHPKICTIYEVDEHQSHVYIAMAYIEGNSLKEKIAQTKLPIDEILNIAVQVGEGLAEAHRMGIVHRDIKPANIMITKKGQAKIMDFGLARWEGAVDITRTPSIMGTVFYMSPEQAQGFEVDHSTDVWSFGCMLYEMITSHVPFAGERDQNILYAIVHNDPRPIAESRPDIPVKLNKIIERCLQKDPRNRYPDTESLVEELKSVDIREVISAPPLSTRKEAPSLAVLPFVDMSMEKDQDYLGEGIAEELIHALARIQELRVVARTSAFALKGKSLDVRDIGRMLNVAAVLEGSVRKAGNRLRITAQLINVEDGFHLWSERFDREAGDIFAIQDEISLAIVKNLKVALRVGEKSALQKRSTDDPEAHNLYLKGLYHVARPNPASFSKALNFFREALDRDPNFALAYAGMANVFGGLGIMNFSPPTAVWPKAKAALQKALSLDENLAEAQSVSASMALWYEWNWGAAEKNLNRVLALKPGDAYTHGTYSWFLLSMKRFDEAVREIKQAINLDPLMPIYYAWSVGIHAAIGRYDEALQEFAKAMEIDPKNGLAYFHAGIASAQKGLFDKALDAFEKSKEFGISPGWAEGCIGMIYSRRGKKAEAKRVFENMLEEMKRTHFSYVCVAWQAATLGNFDQAFEYFDKAYETRDLLMPFIHIYTEMFVPDFYRDPRFKDLLAKMKLSDVAS